MLLSELEGKALEQGNMDLTTYQNAGRGSSCHKNFVACAVPAGILCSFFAIQSMFFMKIQPFLFVFHKQPFFDRWECFGKKSI